MKARAIFPPLVAGFILILAFQNCTPSFTVGTAVTSAASSSSSSPSQVLATPAPNAPPVPSNSPPPIIVVAPTVTPPYFLGVYRGAQNPSEIQNYENWLGRKMDLINDTIPSESWDNMVGGGWSYFAGRWKGNESRLVVTIPMLPTFGIYSGPSLNDQAASDGLAAGAAGTYDAYWIQMRKNLLVSGYGSSMIRLGWEMNGNWYNWRANVNPTAWTSYFRHIVTILRDDPNAHFKIVFNPTLGLQAIGAETVYPGDAYVDLLGLDVYDSDWSGTYPIADSASAAVRLAAQQAVWDKVILNEGHGLNFWSSFAKAHGKSLAIYEWGVLPSAGHGGGDNAFFVQSLVDFANDPKNNLVLLMYFDDPPLYSTTAAPTQFPLSSALFKSIFGH